MVRADVREKEFSTHNATYRGVNLRTMSDVKDGTILRGRLIAAPNYQLSDNIIITYIAYERRYFCLQVRSKPGQPNVT